MQDLKWAVGESVFHDFLKHGIITDVSDECIIVKFENNSKKYRFKFPDIMFLHMKARSEKLNKYLEIVSEDYKCVRCGTYVSYNLSCSKGHLCNKCAQLVQFCSICGEPIEKQDCVKDICSQVLCKECSKKYRFKCLVCEELYPYEDLIVSPFIKKEVKICKYCISETEYEPCDLCGEYVHIGKTTIIDSDLLCPTCAKEKVGKCHMCGTNTTALLNDKMCVCRRCKGILHYQHYIDKMDFSRLSILSMSFEDFKHSRTMRLMSRLRHSYDGIYTSKKDTESFDILLLSLKEKQFVIYYDKTNELDRLSEYECTLTELKKNNGSYLLDDDTCKIYRKIQRRDVFDGRMFYVFSKPYTLKAQTVSDTDYGNEYHGDELVFEGNLYGDTSAFSVLGFLAKE